MMAAACPIRPSTRALCRAQRKCWFASIFRGGFPFARMGRVEARDRLEAQTEFEQGLNTFIGAGRTLMSFRTHSLVPAQDVIEENATAYLVLEWPEGAAILRS